jgi:hypothetical protein
MIHRPYPAVEAAARKRGAARLATANREKALQVRYGMRDHYPGWPVGRKRKAKDADPR